MHIVYHLTVSYSSDLQRVKPTLEVSDYKKNYTNTWKSLVSKQQFVGEVSGEVSYFFDSCNIKGNNNTLLLVSGSKERIEKVMTLLKTIDTLTGEDPNPEDLPF